MTNHARQVARAARVPPLPHTTEPRIDASAPRLVVESLMRMSKLLVLITLANAAIGCGDDTTSPEPAATDAGKDASQTGNPATATDGGSMAGKDGGMDGGSGSLDGGSMDAAIVDGSAQLSLDAAIARGKYLTNTVYPCGSCHTPKSDPTMIFAGVECYSDSVPADGGVGCLNSKNLTNDETGIKQLSDQEVKDLFLKGLQPDGTALFSRMPYDLLGNMTDQDAESIVLYLRSLPPISHKLPPNQPPWDVAPSKPAERFPEADIPQPRADYPELASAKRGRYLAGDIGHCLGCHTPTDAKGAMITTKAFQGGRRFGTSPTMMPVYATNLTPDATGLLGWTADDIVRVLKQGIDKDGYGICGPMPVGPKGAYAGLTDEDARDIANYLLSLPPAQNTMIPNDCRGPLAGSADAGVDASH